MAVREFTGELEPLETKKPTFREFTGELVPLTEEAKPTAPVSAVDQIPTGGITAPPPRPQDQNVLRQFADVPLKLTGGAVTGVRMIADAFGADSAASKNLRGAEDWIAELYSAQSKQDSKRMAQIMKEAEDQGVASNVIAAVRAFKEAPVDLVVNALGTSAPAILASMAAFVVGAPVAVTTAAGLGIGALMGSGTVKSSVYDATKQILSEQKNLGLTPAQIEKIAVEAQEYGGKNTDMILAGSILGALSSSTGAEPIIARQLAKRIVGESVKKDATETALAASSKQAAELAAKRGVTKQAAIAGGKEFGTEFLQGGQEQMAQNIAQQREGFDTPTMRGVVGQGTLEGLAGLGMGVVAGGREAYKAKREFFESQPTTKPDDEALRDTYFTTAGEDKRRAPAAPSADDANLLVPATDKAGKSLTAAAPETTTLKAQADATAAAVAQAAKLSLDEATTKANDLIAKVDAGGKMTRDELKVIGKGLGLTFPFNSSNQAKLDIVRGHLTQQGAPSVATTVPVVPAGRTGPRVAGEPSFVPGAAGTQRIEPSGVVSTEQPAGELAGGERTEPSAVTPTSVDLLADLYVGLPDATIQSLLSHSSSLEVREAATRELQRRKAPAKKSAAQSAEDELNSLFDDDESSLSARRTDAEIARDQKLDKLGKLFGLNRSADETAKQFRARIQEAIDFEKLREDKPLSEVSEKDIAKQTLREDGAYVPPDLQIEAYEEARKIHNDQLEKDEQDQYLPAYKELSAEDRRIYFQEGLPRPGAGTAAQHATAAKKLAEYRSRVQEGSFEGEAGARESYNRERGAFGRKTGLSYSFPAWFSLSDASKKLYAAINKTDTALEQDMAFRAIKAQIQKEKAEQASTEALSQAETDATRQMLDAAERARKSQPAGKGEILPDNILKKLLAGDIAAVLDYIKEEGNGLKLVKSRISFTGKRMKLYDAEGKQIQIRDSIAMGVFRNLAARLLDVEGLKVNVVYDENMVYDQLARYDAKTNTMFVGPNGLDEATILHELLHAATVKIIHQFYTDASKLAPHARKAVEHLVQIAAMAKARLGSNPKFAPAFENLYEFVAYSQTDMDFQLALAQEQVGKIATVTAKDEEQTELSKHREQTGGAKVYDAFMDNLFNAYTGTIAYLYKLFKPGQTATKYLFLVPTSSGEGIKNKVQNPGRNLTGKAREAAIAAFNKKLREEKERDIQRKGEEKRAFEEKLKKAIQEIEDEVGEDEAGATKKPVLSEADKFDRAIGKLEKERKLTADEKAALDIEGLFEKEGEEYEAKIKDIDSAEYVAYENGITNLKRGILREPGYKGNLLLEASEMVSVILEAPEGNIERLAGKEGIDAELYAKRPKKVSAAAPATPAPAAAQPTPSEEEVRKGGVNNAQTRQFYKLSAKEKVVSAPGRIWRAVTTAPGWRDIVRRFQDKTVESRSLFKKQDMAGLINRDMDGAFNNFDEQKDLATGEARNFVNNYLRVPMDNLKKSVSEYIEVAKKSLDDAMIDLHMFSEMFHEPERREVKWVLSVPLSTVANLMHNGKKISAAQRRIDIMGDPRTGKPGIKDRVELTEAQQKQLWAELTALANNHADPAGDSPRIKNDRMRQRIKVMDINKDSSLYNVLGINQDEVNLRRQEYQALPDKQREVLDRIFAEAREITQITSELNKIGNYWSYPVSNLVGMYNYQHYMPFKGVSKHSVVDEYTSFDNKATGKELQEIEHAADGRFSTSDNPFLQMMSDAFRSAGRAGRRNYMQSIKNALNSNKLNPTGTGVIDGEVAKHIEFAERNTVDLTEFKGGNNIFVYNPDGSIDIVRIRDPKLLNALRYSYREAAPTLDMLNSMTGFFGAMHTRYNYNFAPLNFVRDALTNAWTMGAELGPLKSAQYIKAISAAVVKNGLSKAAEVAILHEKGDPVSRRMLADLASKDPFVRDMVEYLRRGGKTTYLESFSLKSNLQDLNTKLGKRRIMDKVDGFNEFVDVWNNMFEFTSRAAAFSLRKQELVKKNIAKGMTEGAADRAAGVQAAAWTKNLANFEKAGEYARGMGAMYMFIRASATGAVRAAEATLPAFRPLSMALKDLPANIRDNPQALAEFKTNYAQQQRSAQIMVGALIGSGMMLYYMSMLMSPDDEWKRNNVKNDNMSQWTRFVRFHIPNSVSQTVGIGRDVVFQVPWGFGLGAFAAIGAQIAGLTAGASTFKEAFGNIVTSLADSFLPLPLSRIPPTESPAKWAIDTITPSILRPGVEWVMNTNGIGQAINSASTRRMGDAYTGGDRIPEAYKDASDLFFRKSLGYIDISPNTLYFFANSYLDGLAKVGEISYSWVDLDKKEKAFNIKTDLPLFGSFFGAKVNVDSREYGEMEKKILELDKRMNTLKTQHPALYAEYEAENPLHGYIVDAYRARQGKLNKLRNEAKEIRNMRELSPKDRESMLRMATMEQNILKHQMVQDFKAYGLDR
jgi:hypothetical protein